MSDENEFSEMEDGISDLPPVAEKTSGGEGLISSGPGGEVYDWQNAPDAVKAPPRIDLDGKTVVINKADIVLPGAHLPWDWTRGKDKEVKMCRFVIHYDVEGQQEFLSGMRVFKRDDGKYSHPSMTKDRKNQASALLGVYADFKEKDINEVTLREFMGFLNGKPKVQIKATEFINPETEKAVKKNIPVKFV